MALIYAKKIHSHEINKKTGKMWCLEDVNEKWREEARQILESGVLDK